MSIWRFGQLYEDDLKIFYKENKLSFDWMDANLDYSQYDDFSKFQGWTCIKPWVKNIKEGDLIFLMNKYLYAGVAIVKEEYKYKSNDFYANGKTLPGIKVEFLHKPNTPIEHKFEISPTRPKAFCEIDQYDFKLSKILQLIKKSYPDKYKLLLDYINKHDPSYLSKIARICWNSNGWVKPSGIKGKAPTDSHEKIYGFGHEEWLFDTSRIIDGYQYGFLEPIRKFYKKYTGEIYNLLLFTRDAESGQKYWVGQLNNVEVITEKMAKMAVQRFKEIGLFEPMKDQLEQVGLDGKNITNRFINEDEIVNIRFKPEEIQNIFEIPIPIDSIDNRASSLYYVLLPWNGELGIKEIEDEEKDYFNTGNNGRDKLKSNSKINYKASTKEIELTHNLISDALLEYLIGKYGESKVKRECRVAGNNRVDMVFRDNDSDIFYEIKTFPQLKTSLRYALGQLIEYSCYPNNKKAKKIILVSNILADQKTIGYINHLNKLYNFNLGYCCFDLQAKKITQEI